MLLKGYTKEIFRPECNPSFQTLHCIAHLHGLCREDCRGCQRLEDCPALHGGDRDKLREYMSRFEPKP